MTQKIKKAVIFIIGFIAFVIMGSTAESNLGILLQLAAAVVFLTIMAWAGAFKKEEEPYNPYFQRRQK